MPPEHANPWNTHSRWHPVAREESQGVTRTCQPMKYTFQMTSCGTGRESGCHQDMPTHEVHIPDDILWHGKRVRVSPGHANPWSTHSRWHPVAREESQGVTRTCQPMKYTFQMTSCGTGRESGCHQDMPTHEVHIPDDILWHWKPGCHQNMPTHEIHIPDDILWHGKRVRVLIDLSVKTYNQDDMHIIYLGKEVEKSTKWHVSKVPKLISPR